MDPGHEPAEGNRYKKHKLWPRRRRSSFYPGVHPPQRQTFANKAYKFEGRRTDGPPAKKTGADWSDTKGPFPSASHKVFDVHGQPSYTRKLAGIPAPDQSPRCGHDAPEHLGFSSGKHTAMDKCCPAAALRAFQSRHKPPKRERRGATTTIDYDPSRRPWRTQLTEVPCLIPTNIGDTPMYLNCRHAG